MYGTRGFHDHELERQKLSGCTSTEIMLRSRGEIAAYFDGWSLAEPGLVHLPLWRPDNRAIRCLRRCGLVRGI